jgi:hypothetical protein
MEMELERLPRLLGALLLVGLALCVACERDHQVGTPPEVPLPGSPGPDYGAALRTAAIRLTGNLPTLTEIYKLQRSTDPAATLNELVAEYKKRGMQPASLREESLR